MNVSLLSDVASHPDRLIPLQAVHNFRDLGGYPTEDGRSMKWRTLFRADGLGGLTTDDVTTIRPLALRTVIDLRTETEITERGRFPFEHYPVDFHHVSVVDATWTHDTAPAGLSDIEFLVWAYREMLVEGEQRFVVAMNVLAGADSLPAVFHCAAGKDRTGLLAALLLGSIGVPHEYLIADYALTAAGMERMLEWAKREYPEQAAKMASVPPAMFSAAPEAIDITLNELVDRYGSIRRYVREIGVSEPTLERLEASLLH